MDERVGTALDLAMAGVGGGECSHQRARLRIDVFSESIILTRLDQPGRTAYEVSPVDVAAAFSGMAIATPILPPDCLFYARAGRDERIGIYVAPMVRALVVAVKNSAGALAVPLPGLVFGGQGTSYWVFAVEQRPEPGHNAELFLAPMPNVYRNGGRICAGNVDFPACSVRTIGTALRLFFESQFNADLDNGKVRSGSALDLWKRLAKQQAAEFPLDELVAADVSLLDVLNRGEVD